VKNPSTEFYLNLSGNLGITVTKSISIVKPTRFTSFSKLFYFVVALYMFQTVLPSIIRSLRLYIQHQVYVKQILLIVSSGKEISISFPLTSSQQNLFDIYLMLYV